MFYRVFLRCQVETKWPEKGKRDTWKTDNDCVQEVNRLTKKI